MLYVDSRYAGHHGIARYAREVVSRLALPFEQLPVSRTPTSAGAVFERGWRTPGPGDLVYTPGYATGLSRARQLLTLHDLIHLRSDTRAAALRRTYYERLVRPAVLRTGHVVTVSETSRAEIRRWLGDAGDAVSVHNCGNACSDVFTPVGPSTDLGRPYLLYVGNLKPHKNPSAAFRCAAALDEFLLVLVTADRQEASRLAALHGLPGDRVVVRSEVDDVALASLYRGCSALLFPSFTEGFGLPALEALSCGAPVVYSATAASVAEICGDHGHPVEHVDDAQEFAAATRRAVAVPRPVPFEGGQDWASVAAEVRGVIEHVR